MLALQRDVRYAFRRLLRSPGYASAVVLTLGLGIGVNTAIFSVVDTVVLRPLPYADSDEVVSVWTHPPDRPSVRNPISLPNFRDWQAHSRAFSGMAAYAFNRYLITGREGLDQTRAAMVTAGFFPLLGEKPLLGRVLRPEDERERVAVLGYRLWQRRYGGDPAVIGRSILLNEEPHTIVGVMPASFRLPQPDIELWLSLAPIYGSAEAIVGNWISDRGLRGYRVLARRKPDVEPAQAEADAAIVAARLREAHPDVNADLFVALVPLREQMFGNVFSPMLVLLGAVAFVLLLACANVADLALMRSAAAAREVAVRRSLGAGDARLIRQVLVESGVLGLLGGALGLLLAHASLSAVVRISPADIPRIDEVAVDARVLAFTFVVSLASGLLFGLAPALQVRRADVASFLRQAAAGAVGHARARRFRMLLVVGEVAVAMVLVAGAGLMLRSFERLRSVDPGFRAEGLLTARLFFARQIPPRAELVAHYERIFERLRALPGVIAAGGASSLPPNLIQRGSAFTIEDRPAPAAGRTPNAIYIQATAGYLRTLGVRLLRGRFFDERGDTSSTAPVAIVNQALARRYFEGGDPVGRRIRIDDVSREIIGVAADVKFQGLHAPAGPQIFVPFAQSPFPGVYAVVRTAGDPLLLAGGLREAVLAVDPGGGPMNVRSMQDVLSDSLATPRFHTALLSLFGGLALFLAVIGVYGVIACGVAERTREIGLRMALGATPARVLAMVLGEGMRLVAAGIGVGLAAALLGTQALSGLLFEVRPGDPATLAAVAAALVCAALLACYVPARRATRVDPLAALRYE
jgi:putative ABC transport system permease protein